MGTIHDPHACHDVPRLIGALEDGELNSELADEFRDLIAKMENAAAETSGKVKIKGKITITIDLALQGGAYEVSGATKIAAPKRTPRRTVLYATEGNTLSRTHPKQDDMFLKRVDSPPEAARIG